MKTPMPAAALIALAALAALASNASAADAVHGKAVFTRWCQGCHEPMPGRGIDPPAGTYTLQQRYKGSVPATIEDRTDLQAAYINALVRKGLNVMTKFRKTEISDADLADLDAYLVKNK